MRSFVTDNPLFSSLQLADGWLTVRIHNLNLNCGLVTQCLRHPGVNAVAPGDELIGLTRGFVAGSPSVLLSLWTVDDEATAQLMMSFMRIYAAHIALKGVFAYAQIMMLKERPHPFFWSPFCPGGSLVTSCSL